jgi:hypothetical protein
MSFEIIVFEDQSLYDGSNVIQDEKTAITEFIKICNKYIDPEYYSKEYTFLSFGNLYVSYADKSGGDKPMNILLIGKLTEESKKYIREQLIEFRKKLQSE